MSNQSFEQFRRVVLADVSLQHQLLSVADPDTFFLLLVELGAAHGYHFTVDEARQAWQASRRAWFEQKRVR